MTADMSAADERLAMVQGIPRARCKVHSHGQRLDRQAHASVAEVDGSGKACTPSALPGQDDADALQKACELGLEGMLLNLASRKEVAPLGVPMRAQLKFLRDCDGLVNKAQHWLLEHAAQEPLAARSTGGREERLKEWPGGSHHSAFPAAREPNNWPPFF